MRIGRFRVDTGPGSRYSPMTVRQIGMLLATIGIATLVTWLLAPIVGRAVFVLVYASVAVSAAVAGVRGGVVALLIGLLLIQYIAIPGHRRAALQYPHDLFSLITFVLVSVLLIALTRSMRRIRRRMGIANADLEVANTELERTNAELARTLDEANRAREDAIVQADRLRLLDEVSAVLASSLDYEATIATTARLVVPEFADWCSVDILTDGEIKQLGSAYGDSPGFRRMSEMRIRTPLSADASAALAHVIRTGEPHFLPEIQGDMLRMESRSAAHLAVLRELGIRSVMIVPMTARGHILGALSVMRNRVDEPFDEGALALGREVASRAAMAIDNAQLYQKAIAANEAKSTFLATMSHELRTPLTAIIGYQSLLTDEVSGPINDTQRRQLERINASARQLLMLIEEVLLYARVEAGAEALRFETVQAKSVVDEALTVVTPLVREQTLRLEAKDIDPALTLETDGGKLRQMLINLLANAVKFTERGSVTVRAYARDEDVVFEVQDTGIGIAPEHFETIFEAFWQVEQTKARKTGGTGLGLSTTRKVARALGGDVTVESEVGVGSTFRIVLPRQRR